MPIVVLVHKNVALELGWRGESSLAAEEKGNLEIALCWVARILCNSEVAYEYG
jgi:hypothetical protein